MFNNIYKGKKVFLTGHSGFKGSWLALWLKRLGADVFGYSLKPPTDPSHIELLGLDIEFIEADVRDLKQLKESISSFQPDIVFHLAAQPLVRDSYNDPVETFEINAMGTVNILEACRGLESIKAIINVTSDKCYENKEYVWGYKEIDPMGGYDPYSASKGVSELITSSYRSSFFNTDDYGVKHNCLVASCRAGNVIGGADWAKDRLIPDIVRATLNGDTTIIRSPHATRPWQHVLEPLSGYLLIGEKLLSGQKWAATGWNFGPKYEDNLNVENVVQLVKRYWDEVEYKIEANDTLHEANVLKLDCSKAYFELKWKSIWNYNDTFERTINWYKTFYENKTLESDNDLDLYIKSARKLNIEWANEI